MRNELIRKGGAWAGGAAAMLVALLLVGLLVQMANGQPGVHRAAGSGTVSAPSTPMVTPIGQPTGTPTIGSKYVTSALTARNVDNNGTPVDVTSTFQVGQQIFVVAHVSNPPAGQHHLTIWWFLNGQQEGGVAEGVAGKPVTGATNVYFTAVYTSSGRGTARLYWDLPTNADLYPDAFLARDVAFEVGSPVAVPTPTPPPTPTAPGPRPTPGPSPTPPPTPTPTPGV